MKKIGILNFHFENKNYGAVLQAAALQYFLSKYGYIPQNIDFQPDGSFSNPLMDWLRHLKLGLTKAVKRCFQSIPQNINSSAFDSFRSKWIHVTEKKYYALPQLEDAIFDFDAYIVGSDQVWRNTYTGRAIEAYFFSFVKSTEPIRIAYAASFGIDQWELPPEHAKTRQVAELARKFDLISVREQSGVNICENSFSVHAELVLDPTLLAGKAFFDVVSQDSNFVYEFDYVAVYKLDQDQAFLEYIDRVEKETGYKPIDIYKKDTYEGPYYSLVEDWVAMIQYAKIIVTDSFHCCCLAAIYNKPFIYYPPQNDRGMTRIYNLFELLSLNSVGAIKPDLSKLNEICLPGNYEETNSLLNKLRCKSSKLLLNAIERRA